MMISSSIKNRRGNRNRLFPLSREVLIDAAQPVATAAVATTCTSLVLAGQGLDSSKTNPHVSAIMNALLFAYLPVGLFGLLVAVGVKTNPHLVGVSSGYLLAHMLIPTVIGGVVNVVKSNESAWIVVPVSIAILVFTVLAWSYLCSYPQVHTLVFLFCLVLFDVLLFFRKLIVCFDV